MPLVGGAKLRWAARLGVVSRVPSAAAGCGSELAGPADGHRLGVEPGSWSGAWFGQLPGLFARAVGAGHERIGGRLGVPVRDRPDPGVLREGHLPPARPRPKSPPFVTILSRCRRGTVAVVLDQLGRVVVTPVAGVGGHRTRVTKAQPGAPARWSPRRRPRCAGKPLGPPGPGAGEARCAGCLTR